MDALRSLDFNPKVLNEFAVRTRNGGILSLIAILLALTLFISELRLYWSVEKVEYLEVDDAAAGGSRRGTVVTDKTMRINFDISFPATPCALLSLDAVDASGANSVDVIHNVFKRRLTAGGEAIGEGQRSGELAAMRSTAELVKEKQRAIAEGRPAAAVAAGACGDCYGAGEGEGACCNTCEEVREAYKKKGWQLMMKGVTQCEQEGFYGDAAAQLAAGEGCNAFGRLDVPKVPGSFHFGPSPALQTMYQHVSELIAYTYSSFNVTHRVNALSFGPYVPEAVAAASKGGRGATAPLDARAVNIPAGTGMHQYFAKLVPLVYTPLSGNQLLSYQFSVTEHFRKLDPALAQLEAS